MADTPGTSVASMPRSSAAPVGSWRQHLERAVAAPSVTPIDRRSSENLQRLIAVLASLLAAVATNSWTGGWCEEVPTCRIG